jgi:hypothetical protein
VRRWELCIGDRLRIRLSLAFDLRRTAQAEMSHESVRRDVQTAAMANLDVSLFFAAALGWVKKLSFACFTAGCCMSEDAQDGAVNYSVLGVLRISGQWMLRRRAGRECRTNMMMTTGRNAQMIPAKHGSWSTTAQPGLGPPHGPL